MELSRFLQLHEGRGEGEKENERGTKNTHDHGAFC